MVNGLNGAAEYEQLLGVFSKATRASNSSSLGHLLIIGFIILGNIAMLLERRQRARPTDTPPIKYAGSAMMFSPSFSPWLAAHTSTLVAWIGAICTLGLYSILYKENKVYRLFEHLFLGLATGYMVALSWNDVLLPKWWKPLLGPGAVVVHFRARAGPDVLPDLLAASTTGFRAL